MPGGHRPDGVTADQFARVLFNLILWGSEHDHGAGQVCVQEREQPLLVPAPASCGSDQRSGDLDPRRGAGDGRDLGIGEQGCGVVVSVFVDEVCARERRSRGRRSRPLALVREQSVDLRTEAAGGFGDPFPAGGADWPRADGPQGSGGGRRGSQLCASIAGVGVGRRVENLGRDRIHAPTLAGSTRRQPAMNVLRNTEQQLLHTVP